jgi:hypothetical protein
VKNCIVSSGEIIGEKGNSYGGIAGTNPATGTIENCYTTVVVVGNDIVGGIAGYNYGVVQYCYATGMVIKNYEGACTIGGIVGSNTSSGEVQNCVALNEGVGKISAGGGVGRIIGNEGTNGTLINNYARNNMVVTSSFNVSANLGSGATVTGIHGAGITATNWNSATWWSGTAGFPSAAWTFEANKLPILKGFSGLTQEPEVVQ